MRRVDTYGLCAAGGLLSLGISWDSGVLPSVSLLVTREVLSPMARRTVGRTRAKPRRDKDNCVCASGWAREDQMAHCHPVRLTRVVVSLQFKATLEQQFPRNDKQSPSAHCQPLPPSDLFTRTFSLLLTFLLFQHLPCIFLKETGKFLGQELFLLFASKETTKTRLLPTVSGTSPLRCHSHYLQEEKITVHSSQLLRPASHKALVLPPELSLLVFTFSSTFPFIFLSKCSFTSARQLPRFSLFLLLSLVGVRGRFWQL